MEGQNTPISDVTSQTRLTGGMLFTARAIWLGVVLLTVWAFFFVLPIRFDMLLQICESAPCGPSQVGNRGIEILESYGMTITDYANAIIIPELVYIAVFVIAGIVLFLRRSDDWMVIFVSLVLVLAGTNIAPAMLAFPRDAGILTLAADVLEFISFALLPIMFFVFPSGRFVPPWTKWVVLSLLGMSLAIPVIPYELPNPVITGRFLRLLVTTFIGIVGIFNLIYRYRYFSTPVERQQTKWAVYGFTLFGFGLFMLITPIILFPDIAPTPGAPINSFNGLVFFLIYQVIFTYVPSTLMPIILAISTLRYRLWDVDPIINRSLVYGGLTVFLGAVFVGGFFGLQSLFELIIGTEQVALAAAASAGIIGSLFNPTRRRLRHFVDQRFYGIEIEYQTPPKRVEAETLSITHLGDYSNLVPIGSGGMADVYKAQDPQTGKMVAIKVLPRKLAGEVEFRKRFEREAQVAKSIQHPNIMQVYEFGEASGTLYMVMDYIEGQDLSYLIKGNGALPLEKTISFLKDISLGMDHAHGQGIVHRDIKPSNVMVNKEGKAILMDFGIARIYSAMTQLTGTGGMVGTLDYIAPEQIQGASDVDGRADVYSLGVMTYQMLTGKLPFKHNNPSATLMAHLMQPPPDPRDVVSELPREIAYAVMQAMAKKPDERYASAGAFVAKMNL